MVCQSQFKCLMFERNCLSLLLDQLSARNRRFLHLDAGRVQESKEDKVEECQVLIVNQLNLHEYSLMRILRA